MKRQGYADRMDESLGMRRGKESSKKQSYKDRRDESRGERHGTMRKVNSHGSVFNLKDGMQEGEVHYLPTSDAERYDMGRMKEYTCGSRGYPAEAWDYKY